MILSNRSGDFTIKVLDEGSLRLGALPQQVHLGQVVMVKTLEVSGRVKVYTPAIHGFTFDPNGSVLRVSGADFSSCDNVVVVLAAPEKACSVAQNCNRTINVNPVVHDELVELKCTGCGGTLERPGVGGSVQCEYCGKPYYMKQAG